MRNEDVMILAVAALAAWAIVRSGRVAAQPRAVASPTGGWYDKMYVPNLLDVQYERGWGYGD